MAEDTEAVHIRVTGKQLGIALTALVTVIGSYPLANSVNSSIRADSFTSEDGTKLEGRIVVLELQSSACEHEENEHRTTQAKDIAEIRAKTQSNEYLIKRYIQVSGRGLSLSSPK